MERKVLMFTTTYCGPCKAKKRELEEAGLLDRVEVIDCMQQPLTAEWHGIKHVPTVLLMEGKEEKKRLMGRMITPEKIGAWLK